MSKRPGLHDLRDLLVKLYPTEEAARLVVSEAQLPEGHIDFEGGAIHIWHNVLAEAERRNRVEAIVDVARKHYPEQSAALGQALETYRTAPEPVVEEGVAVPPGDGSGRYGIPQGIWIALIAAAATILAAVILLLLGKCRSEPGPQAPADTPVSTATVVPIITHEAPVPTATVPPTITPEAELSVQDLLGKDVLSSEDLVRVRDYLDGSAGDEEKWDAIYRLGKPGRESAIPLLQEIVQTSNDTTSKAHAVFALGEIGESAQAALLDLLQDRDPNVRTNALKQVAQLPLSDEVTTSVQDALQNDRDLTVRLVAVETLGALVAFQATDDIIYALHADAEPVRTKAAQMLAFFHGMPQVPPALQKTAQYDPEENPRRFAIESLVWLHDVESIAIFARLRLEGPTELVRRAAADAHYRSQAWLITPEAGTPPIPTRTPVPTPVIPLQKGMAGTAVEELLVHIAPNQDDESTPYPANTAVSFIVTNETGEWSYVELSDGRKGWVLAKAVQWEREEQVRRVASKLWPNGSIITVGFLDGDAELRELVAKYAVEWTNYADLTFEFVEDASEADVRITFDMTGNWSYVGTDHLAMRGDQPTMSLGLIRPGAAEQETAGAILRQFGHVLGLPNEVLNPNANLPWDKEAVYAAHPWSRELVDRTFFETWDSRTFPIEKAFDKDSVMMFPIRNEWTVGDYEIGQNLTLSEGDKKFVQLLYPRLEPVIEVPEDDPLRVLASAVGVLVHGPARCTATVLSDRHIITADFCLQEGASRAVLRMGFMSTDSPAIREYTVDPIPVEINKELHYAILEVAGNPAADYGIIPVRSRRAEIGESMFGAMYVEGQPLVLSRNRCLVLEETETELKHSCRTGGGSAGALLLAASDFSILGLHHSADPEDQDIERATRFDLILDQSEILSALAGE
jgi:HEAT repeat protein